MKRNPAIFLVVACALAGGAALQSFGYLAATVASDTPLAMRLSGLVGMTAAACGLVGGVRALGQNRVRNPPLHLFSWLYCVGIGFGGGAIAWQPLTFSIIMGGATLRLGPDFVGIALVCWYYKVAVSENPVVSLADPRSPGAEVIAGPLHVPEAQPVTGAPVASAPIGSN
jgi:hypothetical protein